MRAPSWVELAGRTAAAESVCITETLEISKSPPETVHVDFHHAPGAKWRVEQHGQPVRVPASSTAVVRIDDQMQQLDGENRLPILGAQFSPTKVLSSWTWLKS